MGGGTGYDLDVAGILQFFELIDNVPPVFSFKVGFDLAIIILPHVR
ncbi:unnamed protein product, partial [marine sediment metagenome]